MPKKYIRSYQDNRKWIFYSSFLKFTKLVKSDILKDIDDPILDWLEFINANSKHGL